MQLNVFSFLDSLMDYRGFSAEATEYVWAFLLDGNYGFNYPKGYSKRDIYEEVKATGVIRLRNDYLEAVIDLDSLLRTEAMRYPGVLHQFTIVESYQGHKRAVNLFQDVEKSNSIESIAERTERCSGGVMITSFRQRTGTNESLATVFYKTKGDLKKMGLKPSYLLSYAELGGREKDFDSFLGSKTELFPHKILGKRTIRRKNKDFIYDQMRTCAEEFKENMLTYTEKR